MAWKNIKQRSMNNGILIQHKALTELDDILKIIKWHNIEKYLVDLYNSKKGERAYPPLMIFKALLLQSWYNLSNQQPATSKSVSPRFIVSPVCWHWLG
jgi:IS5 family transposase